MMKIYTALCALAMIGGASAAGAMPNDPDTTPGGPAFCQEYASKTARVVARALDRKPSCQDYGKGVHSDYNMHYDWCMRTPRTEVEGAASHIRDLVRGCAGPAGDPQQGGAQRQGVDWVRQSAGAISPAAVPAGRDTNGERLFICSAEYNGGLHPGKIRRGFNGCNFGYGSREMTAANYKTMVGRGRWVRAEGGQVPPNALQSGNEADGQPLFVCLASYENSLQPGKIRPGFSGCNFGYGGNELTASIYDVLVP